MTSKRYKPCKRKLDGEEIIQKARKRGLSWSTIYQPYVKLYNAIKRFIDPDYFGLLRWSELDQAYVPKHVNSNKNPYPVKDYFGRSCRRRFGQRDMLCHCLASPKDDWPRFAFLVNSPNREYALICFDLDGDNYDKTCALRSVVREAHFRELPVFEEPSRNQLGCYQWLIIRRDSSASEFNQLCNDLTNELRRRYHDLGDVGAEEFNRRRDERVNFFDGIKATCHFDSRSDLDRLFAHADGNPNDDHRGLLATMPCSGFVNDGDDLIACRMRQFLQFAQRKRGKYVNAVPESHLRDVLASLRPEQKVDHVHVDLSLASASPSLHQSVPSELVGRKKKNQIGAAASAGRQEARGRLLDKAKWHDNPQARMRFASCLFFYEFGQYAATATELVTYYENLSLNTGPDKSNRRHRRAETALDKHKGDPSQPKTGIVFEATDWLPLVETFVTTDVRTHTSRKYRYPIEDELLAAGLCLFTCSVMRNHRTDRMFTVGQVSQMAWYKSLAEAGVLKARYKDKNKRVDVVKMLQLAGLIVLRDSNHKYGGKDNGICDKFGLGVNHPLFDQFVGLYGHVVDPKSLPCVVHRHQHAVA